MEAGTVRRASACLVVDIALAADPSWTPGPHHGAGARLSYLEPRVAEALYGLPDAPVRWHQEVTGTLGDAEVYAAEVLRTPLSGAGTGLAVLHVTLPGDPLATLTAIARAPLDVAPFLPGGAAVTGSRCQTITHLVFAEPPRTVLPQKYTAWPADRQWLWLAATATPVTMFPPDVDDPANFAGLVHLSADWRALVQRDGAAFVALTGDRDFHAAADDYVHRIYLDVLLLGRMQVSALHELSNELARIPIDRVAPRTVFRLERRLMEIRRALWSQHVTRHGVANNLLERYQDQHRLPALLDRVVSELTDASRLIEAGTARSVNAGLGLLTVLGLPFGVAYAGAALIAPESPRLFILSTVAGLVLAGVLLAVFPPLRRMIDALRS